MGHGLRDVVVERVGVDVTLAVVHVHFEIELRFAAVGAVASPVGHELIVAVDEFSAFKEIGIVLSAYSVQVQY